jgi:hypothetical protein
MNMSNTIHLKAGGYISSFSSQYYTRVRIPISVFTTDTSFDVSKCWQINFLTNTAEEPFDVWLDDLTAMPYINTAVQPVFTNVKITPTGGYADNSTLITITAEATDPDNNIKTVSVDLSALNLPNNKKLILSNGKYTCSFKVPTSVTNGKKKLTLTVADANYNITDSVLVYDVFAKGSTEMIWDGDNLATGTFWRHDEVTTTYAIDSIGGHQAPKCMKLHFQHTQQDGWSSIVLDWNENTGNTRRIDISGKRFLNFWLKTGPVQNDFDFIVQIKDQNASSSNAVWIKQKGYVSGFTNGNYQLVSIPIADLMDGATMDLTKVTRIGFISVHSLNGTDVWVDEVYASGSTVADVRMHATPAACAQNGTITVDSIYADRGPYSYYINKKANPAGLHNKTFPKLLPGMYEITAKGDSGFIYIEQVVVEGAGGLKIAGIPDTAGNIDVTVTGGSGQYGYLWSNGSHTEDLVNMVSGTYKLTVTDSLTGCILKRNYIVNNPGLNLSLYPNPATTQIHVNFSSAEPLQGLMTISILDYFGNTVSSRTYSSNNGTDQFTFPNANPGLYYLVVQMNGKVFNRSFMIN